MMNNKKAIGLISGRFRYFKIDDSWRKLEANFPLNLLPCEKDPYGTIAIEIYDPNFLHRVLVYINFAENVKNFKSSYTGIPGTYAFVSLEFFHIPETVSFFVTKEEYYFLLNYVDRKFDTRSTYIAPRNYNLTLKDINYG